MGIFVIGAILIASPFYFLGPRYIIGAFCVVNVGLVVTSLAQILAILPPKSDNATVHPFSESTQDTVYVLPSSRTHK